MTVINLDEYRPHIGGEAVCLCCKHEWHAVAPIGTVSFECPECGTHKGVMQGLAMPETVWECNCGSSLFFIDPNGAMCSICGERPEGF